jgi:hypothetical protein
MHNKSTLLSILLCFVTQSIVAHTSEIIDGDNKKPINIISQIGGFNQNHSFGQDVEATINFKEKIIEIGLFNISNGVIYIINQYSQIIDSIIIIEGDSIIIMNQPEEPGNYILIIDSDNYYGEGRFNI